MADTAFPVPAALPEVLKDFVREILKDQGRRWTRDEIMHFGAAYFAEQASSVQGADSGAGAGMTDDQLVEMLTKLFLKGDVDGNGVLDAKEFKKLLNESDLGLSQKEIKILYTQADLNEDGAVEYREFIPACVQLIGVLKAKASAEQAAISKEIEAREIADYYIRGMSAQEVEAMMGVAFQMADKDGNGFLDQKEFQAFLKDMPLNLTKKEVNAAMLSYDANQDGKISFQEFVPIFHAVMHDVYTRDILSAMTEPDAITSHLLACCTKYDPQNTGFLPVQKVSRAFREADLGLTKFQIVSLCSSAPQGGKGVDYRTWIQETATAAISALIQVDEKVQYQRAAAWKQVTETEAIAEMVLGIPRDEFCKTVGSAFQAADKDKSGTLDPREFDECLRNCGVALNDDQIKILAAAADVDQDGMIQYGEFQEVAFLLIHQSLQEAAIESKMADFLEEIAGV